MLCDLDRSANGTVGYSLVVIVKRPACRLPPIWDGARPPGLPRVGGGSAPIERERTKSRGGEDSGTVEHQRNQARQRPAAWETALEAATHQAPRSPAAEAKIRPQRLKIGACINARTPNPPTLLWPQGTIRPGTKAIIEPPGPQRQGQQARTPRPRQISPRAPQLRAVRRRPRVGAPTKKKHRPSFFQPTVPTKAVRASDKAACASIIEIRDY